MAEYAMLLAGNTLGSVRLTAERLVGSLDPLKVVLFVAALWIVWRVAVALIGPRHG